MNQDERPGPSSMRERLFRQSGLYALGNLAVKAGGLALAFLYLNPSYLSVEEFGYFGLLMVTAQLGIFVVGLGLASGLLKYMTDPAFNAAHRALPFTVLLTVVALSGIALALVWRFARPLSFLLLDGADRALVVQLMGAYIGLKVIGRIPLMLLRVEERAGSYVLALIAEFLLLLGAAFYLMAVRELGLLGLVGAYVVASGVSTGVLVGLMLKHVAWRFDRKMIKVLVGFGVPLAMASLASWFLNVGDRYILKWLMDAEAVGLYEWAGRLAGVLNMIFVQGFYLAFSVLGLKRLGEHTQDTSMHRSTLQHYVIWTGWIALGLSLLSHDLTLLLPADPYYLQADALVLLLSLGFVAYGLYYVLINIVYAGGRSKAVGVNVLGAATLNALLNMLLIPYVGVLGAAVATFLSYLALALGAAHFARQEREISFPWRNFLTVVGLVSGLYVLGSPSVSWHVGLRVPLRLLLILAYLPLLVVTGLYTMADVRQGWDWIKARAGRRSTEAAK